MLACLVWHRPCIGPWEVGELVYLVLRGRCNDNHGVRGAVVDGPSRLAGEWVCEARSVFEVLPKRSFQLEKNMFHLHGLCLLLSKFPLNKLWLFTNIGAENIIQIYK